MEILLNVHKCKKIVTKFLNFKINLSLIDFLIDRKNNATLLKV